jgi:hypothetical protein
VLAALVYWGFHTGKTAVADIVIGLGAPLVVAVDSVLPQVLGEEWPGARS